MFALFASRRLLACLPPSYLPSFLSLTSSFLGPCSLLCTITSELESRSCLTTLSWEAFVTHCTMGTTTDSHYPLTTPFEAPSECLNDFWLLSSDYENREVTWANLGPGDTWKCLPLSWAPSSYFSPGISCPIGWAMSESWTTDGETVGTCCPIHQ